MSRGSPQDLFEKGKRMERLLFKEAPWSEGIHDFLEFHRREHQALERSKP